MTVFHTTPLQRLSQAELRLPFALMRPGNLSFSWKSYAEQVGFHRPSDHCVNPCIIKRLPQSLLLCSMSCYKHWYACPETTALQLTTASISSFCYFYLTTLTDPIHEHYTFDNKSIHKKYENIAEWRYLPAQKVQKHCISIIFNWTQSELEWKCCK